MEEILPKIKKLLLALIICAGMIPLQESPSIALADGGSDGIYWIRENPYPEFISVRITGQHRCEAGLPFHVEEIPFKEYVKSVLANEWGANWDSMPAYRAGAIAVKQYALYQYYRGGKWGGYEAGIVYDCDWDQVYDPAVRREMTDKAVDQTWDILLLRDGEIFPTHYLAWGTACADYFGAGNCLSQRVSKAQADRGMRWDEILDYAYPGADILFTQRKIIQRNNMPVIIKYKEEIINGSGIRKCYQTYASDRPSAGISAQEERKE